MKLFELINLRNKLRISLNTSIIYKEIDDNYSRLINLTENIDNELAEDIVFAAETHLQRKDNLETDTTNIKDILLKINEKIDILTKKFFQDNYQLELEYINPEFMRKTRVLIRDTDFESALKQRINLHSNWQYPALEIGCRDGEWTKHLVASDPLYIADFFQEFLDSAIQQFPSVYQGRVRKYLINDFFNIKNLPKNQFGFIFSYNFFNYLSIDSVKQLLIQSFEWLKPGGSIVFTYNNADLPAAAAYAENYFMTYVPKSLLVPLAESLGFEEVFSYDSEPTFSLIEFKKPGVLVSIRTGQTLGEIRYKD
jgi:SAM-dependent methyltransferase